MRRREWAGGGRQETGEGEGRGRRGPGGVTIEKEREKVIRLFFSVLYLNMKPQNLKFRLYSVSFKLENIKNVLRLFISNRVIPLYWLANIFGDTDLSVLLTHIV